MEENQQVYISQTVAILVDGNNIERSIQSAFDFDGGMINFDTLIPRLLGSRALNRLIYFREGKNISSKLAERLQVNFHGSVNPCHKSADIPLTIKATQLANKVDCLMILSGDSDYIDLVKHLKGEGVRVEICAVEQTTAKALIDEAEFFHPIIKEDIFTFNAPKKKTSKKKVRKSNSK
jgi:uncharacterized LabA/DUF88 family protein